VHEYFEACFCCQLLNRLVWTDKRFLLVVAAGNKAAAAAAAAAELTHTLILVLIQQHCFQ
jgi:hypothetical protein